MPSPIIRVESPPAWRAADLRDPDVWTIRPGHSFWDPLVSSTAELAAAGHDVGSLAEEGGHDLPADWSVLVRRQLVERGIALIDGFPIEACQPHEAMAFWLMSGLLGGGLPQNVDGMRIDVVRNENRATVRGAKTDRELIYHTDFANTVPDLVGLLTIRQAASGGETMLVNGYAVRDRLAAQDADTLAVLGNDFYFDRTGDVGAGQDPIIPHPVMSDERGSLRIIYNRARIHRGHRAAGAPLSSEQRAALDRLDAVLADEHMAVRLRLQPGQVLFTDNRFILHSRTAFVDGADHRTKRELLRVWLKAVDRA